MQGMFDFVCSHLAQFRSHTGSQGPQLPPNPCSCPLDGSRATYLGAPFPLTQTHRHLPASHKRPRSWVQEDTESVPKAMGPHLGRHHPGAGQARLVQARVASLHCMAPRHFFNNAMFHQITSHQRTSEHIPAPRRATSWHHITSCHVTSGRAAPHRTATSPSTHAMVRFGSLDCPSQGCSWFGFATELSKWLVGRSPTTDPWAH